jgi:hypothetical protein
MIDSLRELGFADPLMIATSNPAIRNYAIDDIRNKILGLREFGFDDPVKMMVKSEDCWIFSPGPRHPLRVVF